MYKASLFFYPHYLTSLIGEIGMRELPYGVVLAYQIWYCMYSNAGLAAYIETRMAIHVSNIAMSTSCWTIVRKVFGFLYSVERISVCPNQIGCIRIRQNGPLTRYVNRGLRTRRECRESFPGSPTSKETASYRSRHASRHVRHARAVMHVGIVYSRWWGKR